MMSIQQTSYPISSWEILEKDFYQEIQRQSACHKVAKGALYTFTLALSFAAMEPWLKAAFADETDMVQTWIGAIGMTAGGFLNFWGYKELIDSALEKKTPEMRASIDRFPLCVRVSILGMSILLGLATSANNGAVAFLYHDRDSAIAWSIVSVLGNAGPWIYSTNGAISGAGRYLMNKIRLYKSREIGLVEQIRKDLVNRLSLGRSQALKLSIHEQEELFLEEGNFKSITEITKQLLILSEKSKDSKESSIFKVTRVGVKVLMLPIIAVTLVQMGLLVAAFGEDLFPETKGVRETGFIIALITTALIATKSNLDSIEDIHDQLLRWLGLSDHGASFTDSLYPKINAFFSLIIWTLSAFTYYPIAKVGKDYFDNDIFVYGNVVGFALLLSFTMKVLFRDCVRSAAYKSQIAARVDFLAEKLQKRLMEINVSSFEKLIADTDFKLLDKLKGSLTETEIHSVINSLGERSLLLDV